MYTHGVERKFIMNKINKSIENIEFQKASSEIFLDAVTFFDEAGVNFINSRKEHRYSLSILIDDELKKPLIISPFTYTMSRNALVRLYVTLIKDEKFGGKRRIQMLIKVINNIINIGYKRDCLTSHNIETGKYRLKASDVLGIFGNITSRALEYSLGGDNVQHLGDVYSLLGGYEGTFHFFKEVMFATEASIPDIDEEIPVVGHIADIKCYTCKYCKCDKNGIRTCDKVPTSITTDDYNKHRDRYIDARHDDEHKTLVSNIIDERMDTCDNYKSRIK